MNEDRSTPSDNTAVGWFAGAGLGLFVHWDHASQQGLEISWPLVGGNFALPQGQSVTVEQYHSSAATFDPTAWDAAALARLAREAGATYAVLTTKHHSGYAMFHTKLSELSVEHSPFGRDIVREFVDAVRAEGLRVGFYFSLPDWSAPDYPAFTEADKPYRFGYSPPVPSPERWDRYLEYLFGQITELLTQYGRIDVLWFDGGWERAAPQWRGRELIDLIHSLQPDILVNDRLPGFGDYETPEQFVPARPLERVGDVHDDERELGLQPHRHALQVGAPADPLAVRGGRTGRQPAAQRQPTRRRVTAARAGRSPAGGERVDARPRREHHRHDGRARALAVLRPQHAAATVSTCTCSCGPTTRSRYGACPSGACSPSAASPPAPSSATQRARASSTR